MKGRILITGVAGFIGSNLAERLIKDGYQVIGIDNLSYGIREQVPSEVEFHQLDIRSKEIYPLFIGVDAVFHLAAKNSLLDCQADPLETMDINVVGTTNVFEAVRINGVKKIIYAQSSVLEEGEERLNGFYAISKLTGTWIADGYKKAYSVKSVGLRYFNVYGPRQDYRRSMPPIMSKFVITLLKGVEAPIIYEGDDQNKRDFVYIDDINDFHLLCLTDNRVDDKTFRLGSGKSYSIVEVYENIRDIIGEKIKPVSRPRLKNDPIVVTRADITDALNLGWNPKTSLKNGLQAMLIYIKSEIEKGNIL